MPGFDVLHAPGQRGIDELRVVGAAVHAAVPIRSISQIGVSYMPSGRYEIVVDAPRCTVSVSTRPADRVAEAVVNALATHAAKLAAECVSRDTLTTTRMDAALMADCTTGRRFPAEARGIARPPRIEVAGGKEKYRPGEGSSIAQAGETLMTWSAGRIRAHRDDDVLTYGSDTLTIKAPQNLPWTLLLALPGRQLDQVVDFAVLRGQGAEVVKASINKAGQLRLRVRSEIIGLHEAAKIIDRIHHLRQMGKL